MRQYIDGFHIIKILVKFPFITYEKEKQLRKRIGSVTNKSINNVVYNMLINIILEKPSLYLDQVAAELFDRTGYSTSVSHIS